MLVKVDTLMNFVDALRKCVRTEKCFKCIEKITIIGLGQCLSSYVTPWVERKQRVGECLVFFVLSMTNPTHYALCSVQWGFTMGVATPHVGGFEGRLARGPRKRPWNFYFYMDAIIVEWTQIWRAYIPIDLCMGFVHGIF